MMHLRGGQCICLSAMFFVGKERGMGFAPTIQPHEIAMVMLFRLINPGNSRC